jgi:hypothetical protein
MVWRTQLVCIAALGLSTAACVDDSVYDGGYAGVRSAKGKLQLEQQPAQPTQPTPRVDPSVVPSVRGPRAEMLLPPPTTTGGATALTLVHDVEAGGSWVLVFDDDGTELCRFVETGTAVTYEVAAACGYTAPR